MKKVITSSPFLNLSKYSRPFVLLLLSVFLLAAPSCKKDEVEPVPDPGPTTVTPSFTVISIPNGSNYLDFYMVCQSHDWQCIKIKVTNPLGNTDIYSFNNMQLILLGERLTFPVYFLKISGTWHFQVTGVIAGGSSNNQPFTAFASLPVSAKTN